MNLNRMTTRPLDVPRSQRRHMVRALTSMPAGKMVPLSFVPLLREDGCKGSMRLTFEMSETAEILMNGVYVRVMAYLVPWLAFERFGGSMDIFNRSYNGQPPMTGETVIPFVETAVKGANGAEPIYKYAGIHAKQGAAINTMYAEAYNAVWNFRAKNRSPDITERSRLDTTLAPAFWQHENFGHIVPSFDQAVIDGEVALNVGASSLALSQNYAPLKLNPAAGALSPSLVRTASTGVVTNAGSFVASATGEFQKNGPVSVAMDVTPHTRADLTGIVAELQANGITVSLSNIEQARKTQAFARIREQYSQFDDEWIIDMLMDGLSIPDQALKQPMLLADVSNVFGMNKRYSTDADALMASAVNGATMANLSVRVPRLGTGGVIMVVAEVTPEQLFERQKDPFFHLGSVDELPQFLRDDLDTQKVDVVTNDRVDVDHDTPNGTFGFEPLNARWNRVAYNIGGDFYRPAVDAAFDEDRQRLWAVETENPVLSEDFYLCTTMHQKVFLDTEKDPFEAVAVGDFVIDGHTVFGGVLVEALNNYDAVMAKAPTEQIDQE